MVQILIVVTGTVSTLAYSNIQTVWESERDRERTDRLFEELREFREWSRRLMRCQGHRAPPVAISDASSPPGNPGFWDVAIPTLRLRHRYAGRRERVPLRSRPGFAALVS